jgi:hypothetical protein
MLFKITIITSKFENGSGDTNMRSYNKNGFVQTELHVTLFLQQGANFELEILYIQDAQK